MEKALLWTKKTKYGYWTKKNCLKLRAYEMTPWFWETKKKIQNCVQTNQCSRTDKATLYCRRSKEVGWTKTTPPKLPSFQEEAKLRKRKGRRKQAATRKCWKGSRNLIRVKLWLLGCLDLPIRPRSISILKHLVSLIASFYKLLLILFRGSLSHLTRNRSLSTFPPTTRRLTKL